MHQTAGSQAMIENVPETLAYAAACPEGEDEIHGENPPEDALAPPNAAPAGGESTVLSRSLDIRSHSHISGLQEPLGEPSAKLEHPFADEGGPDGEFVSCARIGADGIAVV